MKPEILKLLRGWLSAFGASVNDEGYIISKDGRLLQTRITTKGSRMVIVGGGDGSLRLFSGPLAQDALHAFVSKFWYWEEKVRWQEAGLFVLAQGGEGELTKAVRACQVYAAFGSGYLCGVNSEPEVEQREIAELVDVYRRTDVHGNVWQLYLEGEKLYEVCHELMEADTYNRMFGNKADD